MVLSSRTILLGLFRFLLLLFIHLCIRSYRIQTSYNMITRRSTIFSPARLGKFTSNRLLSLSSTQRSRLERILANRGIGSRSEVVALIRRGKVQIDGRIVRSTSERYPVNIPIIVDGKVYEEVNVCVLPQCIYHNILLSNSLQQLWFTTNLLECTGK
jgi:hypothetical protein